jgi:hypothetical protein
MLGGIIISCSWGVILSSSWGIIISCSRGIKISCSRDIIISCSWGQNHIMFMGTDHIMLGGNIILQGDGPQGESYHVGYNIIVLQGEHSRGNYNILPTACAKPCNHQQGEEEEEEEEKEEEATANRRDHQQHQPCTHETAYAVQLCTAQYNSVQV